VTDSFFKLNRTQQNRRGGAQTNFSAEKFSRGRFSPHLHPFKNPPTSVGNFCWVEMEEVPCGTSVGNRKAPRCFCLPCKGKAKTASRGREIFSSEKILVTDSPLLLTASYFLFIITSSGISTTSANAVCSGSLNLILKVYSPPTVTFIPAITIRCRILFLSSEKWSE